MRSKARVARCRKIMYVRMFWQMVRCWANHAKLWDVWLIRSLNETKHYGNLTESDFWILCARTIHVFQRNSNCRTRNLMCHFCTVILFWPQKRVISYLMRPILIIGYQNFLWIWETSCFQVLVRNKTKKNVVCHCRNFYFFIILEPLNKSSLEKCKHGRIWIEVILIGIYFSNV